MAEKKFFVDINLQGSALTNATIGTNSGIGSTEGAFGYDSASHRLQYFNGSATQNVANLSDISAVTGGLIFQGGYDPTTDTPDIADGSALKGFFWAATAAGTFLGESVQVGDSIVAKVDNAGVTIADWLILQGNIVIATDSVDGISRLATQGEANNGTEAGAVVITPATLQGKIDTQITPEISNKLPLAGGTMSGNLNMGGNNILSINNVDANEIRINQISNADNPDVKLDVNLDAKNLNSIINLPAPTNGGDAANKDYVDGQVATALPLVGGTMSGAIDMGSNPIENVSYINGDGININSINGTGAQPEGVRLYGSLKSMYGATITDLPAPNNDGDVANKLYVDSAAATAQANAATDATAKADAAETDAKQYADSLAPNYDAAGSAATAESNANDYTDTEIAAQSFQVALVSGDWTLNGSTYEATVTHNLNSSYPVVTFADGDDTTVELVYTSLGSNSITVKSNILPSNISVSLIAARP